MRHRRAGHGLPGRGAGARGPAPGRATPSPASSRRAPTSRSTTTPPRARRSSTPARWPGIVPGGPGPLAPVGARHRADGLRPGHGADRAVLASRGARARSTGRCARPPAPSTCASSRVPWELGFEPPAADALVAGRGTVVREGGDALFVCTGPVMVSQALAAAERARDGVEPWSRCRGCATSTAHGSRSVAGGAPVVVPRQPLRRRRAGRRRARRARGEAPERGARVLVGVERVPACGDERRGAARAPPRRRRPGQAPAELSMDTSALAGTRIAIVSGTGGGSRRYRCEHRAESLERVGAAVEILPFRKVELEGVAARHELVILHRVPAGGKLDTIVPRGTAPRGAGALRHRRPGLRACARRADPVDDQAPPARAGGKARAPAPGARGERRRPRQHGGPGARSGSARPTSPCSRTSSRAGWWPRRTRRSARQTPAAAAVTIGYFSGTASHDADILEAASAVLDALTSFRRRGCSSSGRSSSMSASPALVARMDRLERRPFDELPEACFAWPMSRWRRSSSATGSPRRRARSSTSRPLSSASRSSRAGRRSLPE